MKKIILSMAGVMLITLLISTVIYHQQNAVTLSEEGQLNNVPYKQELQNETEQPQSEQLQPINSETITYSLQNAELNITYNNGSDWIPVPVEKDLLFEGEYNGNKQELIGGSYILMEDMAAFLYSEGPDWNEKRILLTYSLDQGKTWEKAVVTESSSVMRFRKVDFLDEKFGYIIISGGRTMSEEAVRVFLTQDGGVNWEETENLGVTWLISDGGFIDKSVGFLSFGTSNPQEPDLHVTQDAGHTWEKSVFIMPEKYEEVFVSAEVPVKEEEHLAVLVNQGPNGDYKGGLIKGKFISEDKGSTWEFRKEVQPNEAG